jgi:hypothetical protein
MNKFEIYYLGGENELSFEKYDLIESDFATNLYKGNGTKAMKKCEKDIQKHAKDISAEAAFIKKEDASVDDGRRAIVDFYKLKEIELVKGFNVYSVHEARDSILDFYRAEKFSEKVGEVIPTWKPFKESTLEEIAKEISNTKDVSEEMWVTFSRPQIPNEKCYGIIFSRDGIELRSEVSKEDQKYLTDKLWAFMKSK